MSTEGAHNKDANIHQNKYYFKKGIAMCYIKKFSKENGSIEHEEGSVVYCKVTPVFSEGEPPIGYQPEGSCFLYEDYSAQLKPGDIFYEIVRVEVKENARRKGVGTRLVKEFFEKCNPTSVVLKAGILYEDLYEQLCSENRLTDYIYKNIVPFYESLGFTDVNHTTFNFEESVPMLYPKEAAMEAKRLSDEFERNKSL